MRLVIDEREIELLVCRQLKNIWGEKYTADLKFRAEISQALKRIEKCFSKLKGKGFHENGETIFSPFHTTSWSMFLYYLSIDIRIENKRGADMVYYLNKVMHSVDWYHEIELPDYFAAEHPLGSVLGRARYSDYLFVYQGTTIGGSYNKYGELYYPELGEKVTLYANSSILGKCRIGSNVVLSANACVKNEDVPSCSIVYGQSPNLVIKRKSEEEMKAFNRAWEL